MTPEDERDYTQIERDLQEEYIPWDSDLTTGEVEAEDESSDR